MENFKRLVRVNRTARRYLLLSSAIGLMAMTVVIGWQVFARFLLNNSPAWSETFSLVLMLYYVMFASAVGVSEGFHLGIKIIVARLSGAPQKWVMIVGDFSVAVFGLLMCVNSVSLVQYTQSHIIPTLNVSRAVAYWPFIISGVLITVFSVERICINLFPKVKEA